MFFKYRKHDFFLKINTENTSFMPANKIKFSDGLHLLIFYIYVLKAHKQLKNIKYKKNKGKCINEKNKRNIE